jgi:hypothetical protein
VDLFKLNSVINVHFACWDSKNASNMTGLSVLFNLNTEEACYVYGHMESHRRTNEQSINQRYSGLPSPGKRVVYIITGWSLRVLNIVGFIFLMIKCLYIYLLNQHGNTANFL